MEIAIHEAKGKLSGLIKAAETGEQVVLTRHGRPVAEIRAVVPKMRSAERIRLMTEIARKAAASVTDDTSAARSADFLYGDDGMPK